MSDVAVRVEGLSKRYRLGAVQSYKTVRESIMGALGGPRRWLGRLGSDTSDEADTIWALKDVSFDVKHGEVVGIIGRNGAGKSTLLKILSRITEPTEGTVEIHGRVGSLLEVGTGFHPELSGRENIFMNGAILGMRQAEIRRKFDEIVAFAEVEQFIDTPVKRYSTGMYMRLAFAVAAHLEPEILVVDEVLAVGDAQFQKKCLGKMGDVARQGRTVLFVSHQMAAVRVLCGQSAWLHNGRIESFGPTVAILQSYLKESQPQDPVVQRVIEVDPKKAFQVVGGRISTREGELTTHFECDQPLRLQLSCVVRERVPGLYGYCLISRTDGTAVMATDSFDAGHNSLDELPVGLIELQILVPARTLAPGAYVVYFNFGTIQGQSGHDVDTPGEILSFTLEDHSTNRGNNRLGYFSTIIDWEVMNTVVATRGANGVGISLVSAEI